MHSSVGLLPFFLDVNIVLSKLYQEDLVHECPFKTFLNIHLYSQHDSTASHPAFIVVWQDLHRANREQLAMWACPFKAVKVGGAYWGNRCVS